MKGDIALSGIKGSLDANLKEVSTFLSDITPEFIKDLGGMLSDKIKGYRMSQWIDIAVKTKRKIDESGLSAKSIPLKTLLPLIEEASLEADENLQEKWSNLLANAATGNVEVTPNFAQTLKELSSLEAKILDKFFDSETKRGYPSSISKFVLRTEFSLDAEKLELITDNLQRLNLIRPERQRGLTPSFKVSTVDDFFGTSKFGVNEYTVKKDAMEELLETVKELSQEFREMKKQDINDYEFTAFGKHFLRACKWNPSQTTSQEPAK